jgi:hypothetical protein
MPTHLRLRMRSGFGLVENGPEVPVPKVMNSGLRLSGTWDYLTELTCW